VNDIKASLVFGTALVFLGVWLIRWHRAAWSAHRAEEATDERAKFHYRRQFRRRIQVSVLLILVGVMIPLGDWLMVQRPDPKWTAFFWIAVLLMALWIMLLAALDWLSSRMHVRAARAALGSLARKQRELEAEVERLRSKRSNGSQ
jgi:cell division protein FtsB